LTLKFKILRGEHNMENLRDNINNSRINGHVGTLNMETHTVVWGGIIGGALVSIMCATVLNFLGLGLGLAASSSGNTDLSQVGMGAVAWLFVTGILSALVCGWLAGKFSHTICKLEKACHGLVSWSLAMILTIAITAAGAGALLGGAASAMGHNPLATSKMTQIANNNMSAMTASDAASNGQNQADMPKMAEDAAGKLGAGALVLFAALIVSAIASMIAAACSGMKKREHYTV
jgi:hypothetical protein